MKSAKPVILEAQLNSHKDKHRTPSGGLTKHLVTVLNSSFAALNEVKPEVFSGFLFFI